MVRSYNVAIAGATGAVGMEMFSILEQRNFPIKNLKAFSFSSFFRQEH